MQMFYFGLSLSLVVGASVADSSGSQVASDMVSDRNDISFLQASLAFEQAADTLKTQAGDGFYAGAEGESCTATCEAEGLACNNDPSVATGQVDTAEGIERVLTDLEQEVAQYDHTTYKTGCGLQPGSFKASKGKIWYCPEPTTSDCDAVNEDRNRLCYCEATATTTTTTTTTTSMTTTTTTTTTTTQADYVYGDIGAATCPSGYEAIVGDEATCITASTYLGDPYKTNENPDDITSAYCNGRACGDAYNQGTGCENTRMTTSSGSVAQNVCKLATQADYVYGDIGAASCPSGYEVIIGDEATCITASTYLGDPYKTDENPDDVTSAYCNGRACGDAYNQGTGCENTRMTTSSGSVAQNVCKLA